MTSFVIFYPYHFVHAILSNTILSVYHFVHTTLSVPFCPLQFCPRTGWLSYPGLSRVSLLLVSIAFPFAFHISVFFHSLFFTCHWISFVFFLYDRRSCTHSIDPSLINFLDEFPGLGLTLVPNVVYPEAE